MVEKKQLWLIWWYEKGKGAVVRIETSSEDLFFYIYIFEVYTFVLLILIEGKDNFFGDQHFRSPFLNQVLFGNKYAT